MIKNISKRRILLMLADMVAINVSFMFALIFRFDMSVPAQWIDLSIRTMWIYSVMSLVIFSYCELYEHNWRYMTNRNLIRFAGSVFLGVFGYIVTLYFINHLSFPRTVILMQIILATVFVSGIRLLIHTLYFWRKRSFAKEFKNVLIIGAGDAGESLVRDMLRSRKLAYRPVAFLDDDPQKKGMLIHRVPVVGSISEVKKVVKHKAVQLIIIAIPSISNSRMKNIVDQCVDSGVEVKKVPSLFNILDGSVKVTQFKNVEPADILGRDQNFADTSALSEYLTGKIIMVTGAGGSIGSELCRQIMRYSPKQLLLVDNSEFNLYTIDRELSEIYRIKTHVPILANIQSRKTMDRIMRFYQPEIIFHAAAFKHVPLVEDNVAAAIKNNIWGTKNMATLAAKHCVKRFVMISTDKAVNPTNVMGATKRVAEMVVQSMNGDYATVFSAVRFGNVLDSAGSVLPLFKKQIAEGGPVTVTHPDVIRYFMTIPEAVQLVLTTAPMAKGGEIFVLEMGSPVKIADMARTLIKLSGFVPDEDIKIKFVGLRPGEKLYEELLTAEEGIKKTECQRIFIGKSEKVNREELFREVEEMWQLSDVHNVVGVLAKLKKLVPGFHPNSYRKMDVQGVYRSHVNSVAMDAKEILNDYKLLKELAKK